VKSSLLTPYLPSQNEWDKYFPVETNTGDLNIPDFNFSDFTGGGSNNNNNQKPTSFDPTTTTTTSNPNPNANYAYSQSQPDNSTTQQQQQQQQPQPTDLSDVSFGAMSFFPTPSFYADPHPDRLPARNNPR